MIIYGKKRYEIIYSNSDLLNGKSFVATDKRKFQLGVDIMQGRILRAVIPAGGMIKSTNESYTIYEESFANETEVFIALDERLMYIEFPKNAEVYEESVQAAIEFPGLKTINGQSLVGDGDIVIKGGSGENVDLTGYAKKEDLEKYQKKGNYLTEHQKIKTINGQSLVGTGNIEIVGGSVSAEEPLKIVYIGNSFSLNSTEHIYAILEELGHKDFSVDIAMISGSSLQDHLANLKGDLANYAHYHTTKAGRATLGQKTLHDILTYDNWKYIMLQQKSATSDDATTYEDVYEILNYCKKYCPGAKFGWHMGWENVGAVYGNIVNAVKSTILKSAFFDFIIPNGTVIENAKTSKVDIAKIMSTDDLHLSGEHPFGKYTATLGTIKSIFRENVDINTITYKSTLTDEEAAIAKESVMNAYLRPFEVTQSVYVNSSALCTFVINPTPSNAVVTIDGVNRTSVSVAEGTVVAWKVEADGYVTQSGNYTVTDNYTMSVALEEAQPSTGEYEYELYQGFYNETTKAANAGVAAANTKWVCTEVFTRDMLPIGSQVILGEGFQLRHNRWTNDTDLEAERGTLYQKATTIHITEDYWGNYTYMAFSLAYSNGTTVISPTTDETLIREALKIIISA